MHLLFDLGHAMLWLGIGKNIPVLSLSPLSCKMCMCVCVRARVQIWGGGTQVRLHCPNWSAKGQNWHSFPECQFHMKISNLEHAFKTPKHTSTSQSRMQNCTHIKATTKPWRNTGLAGAAPYSTSTPNPGVWALSPLSIGFFRGKVRDTLDWMLAEILSSESIGFGSELPPGH